MSSALNTICSMPSSALSSCMGIMFVSSYLRTYLGICTLSTFTVLTTYANNGSLANHLVSNLFITLLAFSNLIPYGVDSVFGIYYRSISSLYFKLDCGTFRKSSIIINNARSLCLKKVSFFRI